MRKNIIQSTRLRKKSLIFRGFFSITGLLRELIRPKNCKPIVICDGALRIRMRGVQKTEMDVLVAYSSGYGTTREISEFVARMLREKSDFRVQVVSIDQIKSIKGFQTVVVGTSVRADKPLANTRDFFAKFRRELENKTVAIFMVSLTGSTEEGREKVKREFFPQILAKYDRLNPISIASFGGKVDFGKLNPVMQNLVKHVYDKTGLDAKGSIDNRDWDMIYSWAVELREKLKQKHSQVVSEHADYHAKSH